MAEPLQAELAEQMRTAIAARIQFRIGHGLAGGRHDEGGLKRGDERACRYTSCLRNLMRPEEEFRAPARAYRSFADCAGSTAFSSPVPQSPRNALDPPAHPAGCAAVRGRG